MKRIFLLFLCYFVATILFASPVNQQKAQQVGAKFLIYIKQMPIQTTNFKLVYSPLADQDGTVSFYVFNVKNGFVIVSGDDCATPVLGYSTENNFVVENMPENIKSYLQDYAEQIDFAKQKKIVDAEAQKEWKTLLFEGDIDKSIFERNSRAVTPLLTTTWNQSPYYNNLCPRTGSNKAVTGCVATAMAQIINYWEYPTQGTGTHSYTDDTYGNQSVNFANTTYQYSLMPNYLNGSSSPQQINAVATLMYHCGVAVNMDYSTNSSGAFGLAARVAFVNHFGYNVSTSLADRNRYALTTWQTLLKGDLDASHPVYYSGSGDDGGHAFVCDGYDNSNYFHFNWGWSGSNNGYFAIDALNPGTYQFNSNQSAIVNIVPATSSSLTAFLHNIDGITTQIISESTYITHPLGFNYYLTTNYSNSLSNQLILYPESTSVQLSLQVVEYSNQIVYVYDGVGTGGTLLKIVNSGNNTPVTSTLGALTLVYSGTWNANGFKLLVSMEGNTECNAPTNLQAAAASGVINLTWNYGRRDLLSWSGPYNNNAIGTGSAATFSCAQRWTSADLEGYDGKTIGSIMFAPHQSTATFTLKIWTGGSQTSGPAQEVYSQAVNNFTPGQENTITLTTPYTIDASQDLWVGYYCVASTGHPAGVDTGPAVNGKGNMMYFNGAWTTLLALGSTLNYNWAIQANIEDNTTFNIYRNNVEIASNITSLSYSDNIVNAGQYCYTTSANCGTEESDMSNESCATYSCSVYYQFSVTACNSYTWDGTNYTTSGDYQKTYTAANGCDSTVTLHLTINNSVTHQFSI
ncbi:MAG: C10 family peptidase, partial [Bacteroidales bacterium]|nr:C10 family peptidase [Bacteroidales bacterium]